jgi:ribosomal protein S18 acetylase RimI-like enzyme
MVTDAPIRRLRLEDIPSIANLLRDLAEEFITPEIDANARREFLEKNNRSAIEKFVANGFRYHIAETSQGLIGFVGVRENKHLYHLFVARPFHCKGVGRRLWEVSMSECRAAGNPGNFTVNSSNNAVAVYERFGFVRSAPMQNINGVLFNPMTLQTNA